MTQDDNISIHNSVERIGNSFYGPWLILAAATLWGTTGTAQALAPAAAQPAAIGAVRLVIGGLALLLLAGWQGHLRHTGRWPLKATAIAGIGMALYQLTFFAAVQRAGVAVGTIVGIGSAPILGGLLAWFVRREQPGRRWFVATALAIIGCTLLIAAGRTNTSSTLDMIGILLALTAGLSYAAYTVYSKELLADANRPPDTVMAVVFCLGALLLAPLLFTADLSWLLKPAGAAVALHLGIITVALAYALFARGLRAVPVSTAVTLTLAEPLTAGTLGVLLLNEHLTPLAFTGVALLLAGLLFLSTNKVQNSGEFIGTHRNS